jgi:uncharacterized DUF497 family protein
MRCDWNPAQAERNYRAHGVSFEMAAEIFLDPNHIVTENYFMVEEGEQRGGGDPPHCFRQKGNGL